MKTTALLLAVALASACEGPKTKVDRISKWRAAGLPPRVIYDREIQRMADSTRPYEPPPSRDRASPVYWDSLTPKEQYVVDSLMHAQP